MTGGDSTLAIIDGLNTGINFKRQYIISIIPGLKNIGLLNLKADHSIAMNCHLF